MNLDKYTFILIFVVSAFLATTTDLHAQRPVNLESSNLPILVITTNQQAAIVDEPKVGAHLGIIFNENGINHLTDPFNAFSGPIAIELRGNSTLTFPKKSYLFETRDAMDANLDTSLLGLGADEDWILLAAYIDRTFIRESLAHYLSQSAGEWSSQSRFVELVVNGNYMGAFVLIERIKRVKSRLNLSKLTPKDTEGEELTGGYIFEVSGFTTMEEVAGDFGQHRVIYYPKHDEITPEQLNYIAQYDADFRNAMQSDSYDDFFQGYEKFIDVHSFVNELIVQEAMRNSDAYGWSAFFHKDKNSKLKAGPVWDFDQSAGNSSYNNGASTHGWVFNTSATFVPSFWMKLFNEPRFKYRLHLKWQQLRAGRFATGNINNYIDSCAAVLQQAQARNFTRWPTLGAFVWRETEGYQDRNTYQKEVDYLKAYLAQRMVWIDQQLSHVQAVPLTPPITAAASQNRLPVLRLYPNPATHYLVIDSGEEINQPIWVQIYNSSGTLVQNNHFSSGEQPVLKFNLNPSLANGLYHIRIIPKENKPSTANFIIAR